MGKLTGKTAIVAGGAGGIGGAICETFAAEGGHVICADLSERRGTALVDAIVARGGSAQFARLDAGLEADWKAALDLAIGRSGRLDTLVTSFFSGVAGSVESMTPEAWADCFRATSTGVFLGMHICMPAMTEGGAVINIASLAAHRPDANNIGYSSAKAAVLAMSRSAALAGAKKAIRVNTISPGSINTRALHATVKALAEEASRTGAAALNLSANIPLGRIGEPVEIAHAACFLASDDAAYITGADIPIDGGLSLR